MKKYYQQGDVLLKRIDKLPEGLKKVDSKVLQEGETTGHMHQFAADAKVKMFIDPKATVQLNRITPDEGKFIVVGEMAYLRHEEHNPIGVDPGIYQIDIVREYDYEKDEMTRVVD